MAEGNPGNVSAAFDGVDKEKKYWLGKLSGGPVKSYFPYDRIRTHIGGTGNAYLETRLPDHLFLKLNHLTNQSDKNLFVVLSAALTALLGKYTGNTDIILTAPIYKQAVEGDFINTVLPLRNRLEESSTFKELLGSVKKTLAEADLHLNYPMDRLLFHLGLPVSGPGDFPLSETAILLENIHHGKYLEHMNFNMVFAFSRTDRGLEGVVEYNPRLYKRETVERIFVHFTLLLTESLTDPGQRLDRIRLLTEDQQRLLAGVNDTRREFPRHKTICELFEEQAGKTPDRIAVVGTSGSDSARFTTSVTYGQLDRNAGGPARLLREKGVKRGVVVGIMVEPSVETITGIFAVLKAGGTYLPLEPDFPVNRLKYLLNDSGALLLLTRPRPESSHPDTLFNGEIIEIDRPVNHGGESSVPGGTAGPEDNIYALYTSGTTGKPKGVLIKNENLVNYVNWFSRETGLTGEDRSILTSSFIFDLGYSSIYPALLNGGELHIAARETYLDPGIFLRYAQTRRITYLKMTPSLFNVIINSPDFTPATFRGVRLLVSGGEAIDAADIRTLHTLCPQVRVMDEYGPTESTIGSIALFIDPDGPDLRENPTVGHPIDNTRVLILDSKQNPLPPGVPGEICLAGAGLAQGYLNNPELTAGKFTLYRPGHPGDRSVYGPAPLRTYRTGDLGRWLDDGGIEFHGRIDHQVKIRGYRIEPGEAAAPLQGHEDIKEAVVTALSDHTGTMFLCAYFVPREGVAPDISELKEHVSRFLPEYMVPAYFVPLEKLPLTSNGKLDRGALPLPEAKAGKGYIAPRDKVEEKLVCIWSDVLNRKTGGSIGIRDNFFELSGNSLSAVTMISKIHKELNVRVPLAEIFKMPTILGLSDFIRRSPGYKEKYSSIEPVEKKEYYPLSSAQARMYIVQQVDPGSTAYNSPSFTAWAHGSDSGRLQKAFVKLIHRHESLRTSFFILDGEAVQKVHDTRDVEFKIECFDIAESEDDARQREFDIQNAFVRPFDLSRVPLLRIGLVKTTGEQYRLMVDKHHILSDGIADEILIKEFVALYEGRELSPLPIQYKDYALWQKSEEQLRAKAKQETYWLSVFQGEVPQIDLPIDYERPDVQSFEGKMTEFELPPGTAAELKTLALEEEVTLYMLLLAVFYVFLAKLSGREDIVVGTPVSGRRHADLEHVIGLFVNTVALRNRPAAGLTFRRFLEDVKHTTLDAFENQDYPFEELVRKVAVNRDIRRNPLFDVMFALHNIETEAERVLGDNISQFDREQFGYRHRTSQLDLILAAEEKEDKLVVYLNYSSRLFKDETIEKFIVQFMNIVSSVLDEPGKKIKDIEIMSEEEQNQMLSIIEEDEGNIQIEFDI